MASLLRTPAPLRAFRAARARLSRFASTYNKFVAGLTESQENFRQTVQDFANKELAPRAEKIDRDNTFPMVSWRDTSSAHSVSRGEGEVKILTRLVNPKRRQQTGHVEEVWRNGPSGNHRSCTAALALVT
ncbi:MAG: hypothetical protein BJ554DRAFT_27 [Olpidium bornovanus]|uniref:Acyl-CoA dehydrogenase/oxidase N-terminal domain-containing protein n=1 Tax=Olpidium bornovanus TaxID=278681 RepID=A0A8H8DIZ1_9FUNG|nr:MAG: hypothetical protein BJ554DRAFT_27 [Olpidium bornovanus]